MKRLSVDSILNLMSQVDDTLPLCIEDDSGEINTFNISRAKYSKAIKDKTFARQLLVSHKNAIYKQSTNALSTSEHGSPCVQDLVELHLCDGNDNNKQYILLVSKTDYEQATNNVLYAAELLENHKKKVKEQRHDLTSTSSPSNSKAIIDKQSSKSNILSTSEHGSHCEAEQLFQLKLIDGDDDKQYNLLVTKTEYARASSDMLYAAQLLENYKTKNQEKGRHTSTSTNLTVQSTYSAHASTSSNNIVEPVDSNDCDNEENVEDTVNLDLSMCNKDSRCTWNKNQAKLLLSLYKEHESKLREGKITHRKFWIVISNQLKLKGYTFTSNQCKFKLDSLKKKYKVIVDHNSQSGNDRKTCDEFELLEDLFANKPWVKPLSIAGSNVSMDDMDQPSQSKPTCKRQKLAVQEATIKYMNDCAEDKKLRREATAQYREKKLELFGNLVHSLQPK